ncbi:hypothetical protein JQ588_01005 [Bradyrhizobium liaoningense]|nr:hypothetical protein [Bradyrhizobium liaoningense]
MSDVAAERSWVATQSQQVAVKQRSAPSNDIVTEDSAARDFIELHGSDLRYCHSAGTWFRWNGVFWERDKTGMASHWAREFARGLAENQDKRARYITSKAAFAANVERFARNDPAVAVTAEYWNQNIWVLGTPGGTVDLKTGGLREPTQDDGITKLTTVAPSQAPCPRWLEFLRETTGGDTALVRFLQQWCGYGLTGDIREHALVFVYGPGGNGKSVFLNVTTSILGDYAVTSAMETFVASRSDRHSTELAMLQGARVVTASETDEGRPWAEARIKQVTGGDRITARFMRQDNFTFTPQFKLTITGNHKPTLQNVDDAARRRFLIVPFEFKPERPDPELESKLLVEAGGILQWMIDGCLDWQQNGLMRPERVMAATKEYFADQDAFSHWLDECSIRDERFFDMSSELFKSWKEYALASGVGAGGTPAFKEKMKKCGFISEHTRAGTRFLGLKLTKMGR